MKKDEIIKFIENEIKEHFKREERTQIQSLKSIYYHTNMELIYILSKIKNTDYETINNTLYSEYEKEKQENENI